MHLCNINSPINWPRHDKCVISSCLSGIVKEVTIVGVRVFMASDYSTFTLWNYCLQNVWISTITLPPINLILQGLQRDSDTHKECDLDTKNNYLKLARCNTHRNC